MTNLGAGLGQEQSGTRPALVVSVDAFNRSGADLVVIVPLMSRREGIRTHVEALPAEAGLTVPSYVKCEDVRLISPQRLIRLMGTVSTVTTAEVETRLRFLLGL
jgi:mRNA interferase MazF